MSEVRVSDTHADETYRRRIEHERSLGQAYVGGLLDRMCRDLGLDPVEVWRRPRADEEADRRFRRDVRAFSYETYWGICISRPPMTWSAT